jgi:polyhydroxyalkanoate synthesis regulator phasin
MKVSEPVQDAVKAYLELAMGLTEASKKKAEKTVKKVTRELIGKSGATASQLQGMAEDLVNTGLANREAISRLVRVEMDRALGRLGLATAEDVATLTDRLEALERMLRDAATGEKAPAAHAQPVAAAKKAPAKTAVTRKTVAKKSASSGASADVPAAAKKAPAKRAPAKRAPAKRAPAKKAVKKAEPREGQS